MQRSGAVLAMLHAGNVVLQLNGHIVDAELVSNQASRVAAIAATKQLHVHVRVLCICAVQYM